MNASRRALLLATCVLAAAISRPGFAEDKVIVGFDGSYPPFASVGTDGQLQGFDVDLVKAVCATEKLQCELKNVPYDGIFAALDSGKISVIAAGMNITDERKQKYAMPGPYLKSPLAFLTTANSSFDGTKATLSGSEIGTVGASVFEKYLNAKLASEIDVKTYDSMDAAVLDLDAGRVAAVFGELVQLQPAYVQAKPNTYKIAGEPVNDSTYAGQGKGLIVRLADKALADKLNDGISAIAADGTHAQLTKKWFGVEVPAK
ncbi:amino acid ABC transporter substrate-binding protein (plasmid) [Rhizobium gallicum]|uniref:Amino acid ABC transporter substrate-binding protein n=1 Tax=Rhizobium gallicum TaxID=56730 RepID=A0A1L5NPJ7_9HYPH|nr:transporter substrate-binding domain-containing protein [Rhizobium gallicum]APO69813.1 amino acid ABC transporter substrate-binding protein [Rhizobium gallicum]